MIKGGLFFNIVDLCGPHTSYIGVAVLEPHSSKKSETTAMTSSHRFFFAHSHIYIYKQKKVYPKVTRINSYLPTPPLGQNMSGV